MMRNKLFCPQSLTARPTVEGEGENLALGGWSEHPSGLSRRGSSPNWFNHFQHPCPAPQLHFCSTKLSSFVVFTKVFFFQFSRDTVDTITINILFLLKYKIYMAS